VDPSNSSVSAALSPEGSVLATASIGTSILLWTLAAGEKKAPKSLSASELKQLWDDLAGTDLPYAYEAIRILARSPEQSVAFLKARLPPVPKTHISRLIENL